MIHISRLWFVVLAVAVLGACSPLKVGRDFDVLVFTSKIERGVTTQEQVRAWLGEPASTGVNLATDGEAFDEWAYYYAEGRMSDMSGAKVKMLQVKFDKQGKVRAYNWSVSR